MTHKTLLILFLCSITSCGKQPSDQMPSDNTRRVWASDRWQAYYESGYRGFKDAKGQVVIPPKFLDTWPFRRGRAFVKTSEGWMLINEQGNPVSDYRFTEFEIPRFKGYGIAALDIETPDGPRPVYVNEDGVPLFKPIYEGDIQPFSGRKTEYGCISGDKGTWFFDRKGNVVAEFKQFQRFKEGLAPVVPEDSDDLWGYIDNKLKLVCKPRFEDAKPFCEGFASVAPQNSDGLWGYINQKFELVIPARFEDASLFSEGLAVVVKEEKAGFINSHGEIVIPCQYEMASNFVGGHAAVEVDRGWVWLDKQGHRLTTPAPIQAMLDGYSYSYEGHHVMGLSGPSGYVSPPPAKN